MAWTNPEKLSFLLKSDLGMILQSDGVYGILIETGIGSEVWAKDSKNAAVFANPSKNNSIWTNQTKS
jgi:hypothetical protein